MEGWTVILTNPSRGVLILLYLAQNLSVEFKLDLAKSNSIYWDLEHISTGCTGQPQGTGVGTSYPCFIVHEVVDEKPNHQ